MITLDDLNKVSLGDYEPHTTERWKVLEFPVIGSSALESAIAESIDLPFPTFQDKSKPVASSQLYFASGSSVDGFTVTFGVDQKWRSVKYITSWTNLVQNPVTGGFRLPSAYKKNLQIGFYNLNNDLIVTAHVANCWPLGISNMAFNAEVARTMISVPFKCEAVFLEFA